MRRIVMNNHVFTFTLSTTEKFNVYDSVFTEDGNPIGHVLSKYPVFKDEYDEFEYDGQYSYVIGSIREIYDNLCNGKVKLNLGKYHVNNSSTYYIHKEI